MKRKLSVDLDIVNVKIRWTQILPAFSGKEDDGNALQRMDTDLN